MPTPDAGTLAEIPSLRDAIAGALAEAGYGEADPVPPAVLKRYPRLARYFAARADDPEADPGDSLTLEALTEADQLAHDRQTWGDPLPFDATPPAEPFPLNALPAGIRAAVEEYAATGQQPLPLIVAAALAPLSLAGQGLANVERAENLAGPCSLSLLVLASSGERKSSADRAFRQVVADWEKQRREDLADAIRESRAKHDGWVAEGDGLRMALRRAVATGKADPEALKARLEEHAKKEPRVLVPPQLRYEDANAASLPDALALGHPSAALWSAEAGIVTGGQGMQREGLPGYLALLNVLWDGGAVTQTRKVARGVRLEGRRLTVSLMVQPEVLAEFLARSGDVARGSGFLARFLLTEPESTIGHRPFVAAPEGCPAMAAYHERIRDLLDLKLELDTDGRLCPPVLALSPGAFARWRFFHDGVELDMRSGGPYVTVPDWASKTAEQAARLAALFHLWDMGPTGEIGVEHLQMGTEVARWFLREAVRFVARTGADEPPEWRDARALDRWLEGRAPIGLAEILRYGPNRVRKADRRDAALGILAELHRVRAVGGRVERSPFLAPLGRPATAIPAISAISEGPSSKNSGNSSSSGGALPALDLTLLDARGAA